MVASFLQEVDINRQQKRKRPIVGHNPTNLNYTEQTISVKQ
jgi:hypothetical protein